MSSKLHVLNSSNDIHLTYTAFILYSLAKRAIIATQTVVVDGTTEVQVIDAVEATVNAITTVVKTETVTETDATYICK